MNNIPQGGDSERTPKVNLTAREFEQLEREIQVRLAARPPAPTLEGLTAQGYKEATWVTSLTDGITGAALLLTNLAAEIAQAFAPLVLAILFIALEANRIQSGVVELGQDSGQALLIAVTFVSANFILPLYRLRRASAQGELTRVRPTLRGYLMAFWRRIVFLPQSYSVGANDNPTLGLMEGAITWATISLALMAVLGPMLGRYSSLVWYSAFAKMITDSNLLQIIQLVAGCLISIGGVFGVQSISHEFGVRSITDRPQRLADVLQTKLTDYQAEELRIRREMRASFEAAKLGDQQRRREERAAAAAPIPFAMPIPSQNGHSQNGNGNHS